MKTNWFGTNLQDRFPKRRPIGADSNYEALMARVVGFVEAPKLGFDFAPQCAFPTGQISYAEVARRIGSAKAVRAVVGACAASNLAVAIPCHRVVMTACCPAIAWGVERKRALLYREAALTER
jgi:AraC family transcriptional regulator, regulatory protein of adaptative response / methylated-DNA-[protein]-cysteine methyltransferase